MRHASAIHLDVLQTEKKVAELLVRTVPENQQRVEQVSP